MSHWIPVSERLPDDGQRVLCYLPKNTVYLPGKTGATEERPVVVMRFADGFFTKNPSKTGYRAHRTSGWAKAPATASSTR